MEDLHYRPPDDGVDWLRTFTPHSCLLCGKLSQERLDRLSVLGAEIRTSLTDMWERVLRRGAYAMRIYDRWVALVADVGQEPTSIALCASGSPKVIWAPHSRIQDAVAERPTLNPARRRSQSESARLVEGGERGGQYPAWGIAVTHSVTQRRPTWEEMFTPLVNESVQLVASYFPPSGMGRLHTRAASVAMAGGMLAASCWSAGN